MLGPNSGTILIADDRYRKLAIAAVPQPIPMSGSSVWRRTDRQSRTNHQRTRSLQHEVLGLDTCSTVGADGTRFGFFVVSAIAAEHVIGRYIHHPSVRRQQAKNLTNMPHIEFAGPLRRVLALRHIADRMTINKDVWPLLIQARPRLARRPVSFDSLWKLSRQAVAENGC